MKALWVRIGTTLAATLIIGLGTTSAALGHGTYPSAHRANAWCYTTSTTGTWTMMSSVYMDRADGYPGSVIGIGGSGWSDTYGVDGRPVKVIDGFSEQWLYYRVAVASAPYRYPQDYTFGNWIARKDALGDHTDGQSTYFQMSDGSWRLTGYTATGSPWDVSLANGYFFGGVAVGGGRKLVYGQLYWGQIYNLAGQQAFAPYTHWEPIGYRSCG